MSTTDALSRAVQLLGALSDVERHALIERLRAEVVRFPVRKREEPPPRAPAPAQPWPGKKAALVLNNLRDNLAKIDGAIADLDRRLTKLETAYGLRADRVH